MRLILLFIFVGSLFGCGSEQPAGELNSCIGQLTVKEDYPDISWSSTQNLSTGTSIGQYVRIRNGIVAKEIMLRSVTNSATSFKVNVYKNRRGDTLPLGETPLKTFTVTSGLTVSPEFEMWLQLPEPFEFEVSSDDDIKEGRYYFITFEPVDGGTTLWLSNRDTASRLREGLRWGTNSNPPWHPTDTTKSLGLGLRGESNCQSMQN